MSVDTPLYYIQIDHTNKCKYDKIMASFNMNLCDKFNPHMGV